ncbi:unnamed protein product [Arctia plantaginis]|uniref:Uncharacterized protein n=1 Tax=Arctia plantaginis TaxID=874455 RepID=A0A8S0YSY2_ARCPL|nr:unnamed protein product [Arctia plantaginis]
MENGSPASTTMKKREINGRKGYIIYICCCSQIQHPKKNPTQPSREWFDYTKATRPMDKSVYRSFEHHWDQELIKYVSQHPERTLNKTSFNVILSQVWPKCMTITNISNGFRATGLYPYNPDAIPEEAFASSALSELSNPTNSENIAVLSHESGEQEISSANVEDSDGSGTHTENLPLSLLSKNNPNAGTPHKIDNQSTTCEIHEFLPTPKFKVKATAPRKKSLNYRAQEVTKDLFGDNATNSTSQITTVPSSRVEDVRGTSSMIKINTKRPKSACNAKANLSKDCFFDSR